MKGHFAFTCHAVEPETMLWRWDAQNLSAGDSVAGAMLNWGRQNQLALFTT